MQTPGGLWARAARLHPVLGPAVCPSCHHPLHRGLSLPRYLSSISSFPFPIKHTRHLHPPSALALGSCPPFSLCLPPRQHPLLGPEQHQADRLISDTRARAPSSRTVRSLPITRSGGGYPTPSLPLPTKSASDSGSNFRPWPGSGEPHAHPDDIALGWTSSCSVPSPFLHGGQSSALSPPTSCVSSLFCFILVLSHESPPRPPFTFTPHPPRRLHAIASELLHGRQRSAYRVRRSKAPR